MPLKVESGTPAWVAATTAPLEVYGYYIKIPQDWHTRVKYCILLQLNYLIKEGRMIQAGLVVQWLVISWPDRLV